MKRKRGRPSIGPKARRSTIGFRTTHGLKDKLAQAANANGRSISQEAEFRVERSFHEDWIIEQLIAAMRRTAG